MEKKGYLFIIAILVIFFGIYVFNYPPNLQVNSVKQSESTSLSVSTAKQSESRPSLLRMSLIEEMVQNYRKNQLNSIENSQGNPIKDDASAILFDLDTLKKFIADIEKGVKQVEPSLSPKLAIRMYYAAYPAQEKWSQPGYQNLGSLLGKDIPKLYERKHTLIMLPVIRTEKGIYADFNPFDKTTYNGFPKQRSKSMSLLNNPADTTEIPALNHGQLIPPASTIGEGF